MAELGTSSAHDKIRNGMLETPIEIATQYHRKIINMVTREREVAEDWQMDTEICKNYRAIPSLIA